jgi:hypothetical protein
VRTGLAIAALPLLALLAAGAAAGPGPASSLTARSLDWPEAEGSADAILLRLHGGDGALTLAAPAVHVRSVEADLHAQSPVGGTYYAPGWTTRESDLTAADLQILGGRAGSFLYLLAEQASARVPCGSAQPSQGSIQAPSHIEQPNPHPTHDLSDALAIQPCGPVEVCGSFTLVLWERDVFGSSAEGSVHLESGQLARPGEPDARPVLGRARQLSLGVAGGCLSLPGAEAAGADLFARGASLDAAPALVLRGAYGTLAGAAAPVDGDLHVTGRLAAALARSGAALGVALAGDVDGAAVNGLPLGLASASAAPGAPLWAWLLSAATVLPAAALGALWARASRPESLLHRAQAAAASQDWGRVLHLTTRRLRRGEDARTRILRADALLALEDPTQALSQACLALFRLPDGPTKADAALVACRASSRLGRDQEALAWLGEVYAQDLRTAEHALRFPEVARLTTVRDVSYS